MRIVAAIVALLSGPFLAIVGARRRAGNQPQRQSDGLTIGVAILILMASTMVALARPAPVTSFDGDRYSARQAAPASPAKARHAAHRRAPVARNVHRHARVPAPRTRISEPYRAEAPLSLGDGIGREVVRMVGRPAAWCGWWLGQHLGMPDRRLWLARNWASVGSNAGGPQIGAVVVWRHHVGIITGRHGNQWVVKSGNDGRRVRERPRSVAGAIAFRRV